MAWEVLDSGVWNCPRSQSPGAIVDTNLIRRIRRTCAIPVLSVVAFALAAGASGAAMPVAPLHGGAVSESNGHVFESLLAADGLHVWLFTDESAPAMAGSAAGTASLKLPDGKVREVTLARRDAPVAGQGVFFCPMHAEVVRTAPGQCEPCGGMKLFHQDELFGASDLKGLDLAVVAAQVRVTGLKGKQKEASFSPAFPQPDGKAAPHAQGQ
jgi:hypothetical protein